MESKAEGQRGSGQPETNGSKNDHSYEDRGPDKEDRCEPERVAVVTRRSFGKMTAGRV